MPEKFRIAVVGCGKVSTGHIQSWQAHPDKVQIVGLYDPVRQFCEEKRKDYHLDSARIYDNYEQVLDDPGVDVVNLCSSTDTHDGQIPKAMDAGKHIMTEKPTGYTMEGCRRLRWYARKYPHLKVGVAYSLRYSPLNIEVRKLIKAGAIGQPMWAHIEHTHQGHARRPDSAPENWGVDHATDRGGRYIEGSEMAGATHPYDLARYMMGEPLEVYAARNASGVFVTLTHADQSISQVQSGSTPAAGLRWVVPVMVQGTEGTIFTQRVCHVQGRPAEHLAYLMNDAAEGAPIRRIAADADTTHGDKTRAANFIAALFDDAPLICDLEDSVRTSEMLHAIWNSYSLGIRVPIQRRHKTG